MRYLTQLDRLTVSRESRGDLGCLSTKGCQARRNRALSRQALLASVVSGVLLPVPVGALGLGEISSQAALNEPFTAEVALLGVKPDELDTVKVALASPKAYEKAGIDRPQHLSKLRFRPQVMPDGRIVIGVSSARFRISWASMPMDRETEKSTV